MREGARIVTSSAKRSAGKNNALSTVCLGVVRPAGDVEGVVARRRLGQSGTITRVAFQCPPEQVERPDNLILFPGLCRPECP